MKLGQTQKQNTPEKSKPKLVSGPDFRIIHPSIRKSHQFENCRFCMADKLNGHGLPVCHTEPYKY